MSIAERGFGKLLVLIGILVVALAFFLAPWVATDVIGFNLQQQTAADLGLFGVPIAAGLALLGSIAGLNYNWRQLAGIVVAVLGVFGLIYVLANSGFRNFLGGLVDVHPGMAFWAVVVGFALIIIGGLLEILGARSRY